MIYEGFCSLTGNTPLFKATSFAKAKGVSANLYMKLEYFNPAGSVKDRVAVNMLLKAKEKGVTLAGGWYCPDFELDIHLNI